MKTRLAFLRSFLLGGGLIFAAFGTGASRPR